MIRDPFYKQILEALDSSLDEDCFELCANSLLKKEMPTLVPIRGGTDGGMDGATAADGSFLIATTGADVIRNLTSSLKSYLKDGGSRRTCVLATTQEVSKRRRTNLENRANQLGFSLLQIYSREAIAERLYYSPRWCKELLGLAGRPSALTLIPLSDRPVLDYTLVGRDDDVRWLRTTSGDRLLTGPPGCGKTFALRHLALKGWGLFLADENVEAIANAIREQKPKVIIIDDAHFRPEILTRLRQLRDELFAKFDIVATSWTGDSDVVADALLIGISQRHELPLLTRDEIVQVIEHAGLGGPRELIREIVDQSEGRPGLAVTLTFLSLHGGAEEVFYGDALKRSLVATLRRLVGDRVVEILASFALGGDQGVAMESVAQHLGIPLVDLRIALVKLSAGGVIRQRGEGRLSVWPRSLRYVLVRDVFFGGQCDLPKTKLMEAAHNRVDLAETLIGAISRGAHVPEIIEILESLQSPHVWRFYASLGEEEAKFVVSKHSELIPIVGRQGLELAPEATLPLLFEQAIGDERDLGHAVDHPLRWVEDWIRRAVPGRSGEPLKRRTSLLRSATEWLENGKDGRVGRRALCMSLKPGFETHTPDPGSGLQIQITSGLLNDEELKGVRHLWYQIPCYLDGFSFFDWQDLLRAIEEWIYPELSRAKEVSKSTREIMRAMALQMISDVVPCSREHPSVQQWARRMALSLGATLKTTADYEFETLFPKFDDGEKWEEEAAKQFESVRALAEQWKGLSAGNVAIKLRRLESNAAMVSHTWPRWTPNLCTLLATDLDDPSEWLSQFMEHGLAPDAVAPFLRRVIEVRTREWRGLVQNCFDKPLYEPLVTKVLLITEKPPSDLLAKAVDNTTKYPQEVEKLCIQGLIPENTLKVLLSHADDAVSSNAAIGMWWAKPRGEINGTITYEWRQAILRAEGREDFLGTILKSDTTLTLEWLFRRIDRGPYRYNLATKEVKVAVSGLNFEQKRAVLQHVNGDEWTHAEIIAGIVGSDLEVYKLLLEDDRLKKRHLAPLSGHPVGDWVDKATLAIAFGYSPEDVADATVCHDNSWVGEISNMWQRWIDEFDRLATHEDMRIRSVADLATKRIREFQVTSRKRERQEAVFER